MQGRATIRDTPKRSTPLSASACAKKRKQHASSASKRGALPPRRRPSGRRSTRAPKNSAHASQRARIFRCFFV
eukprot:scaffold207596_cov41-Tisochrysis_lutea.AAC.1